VNSVMLLVAASACTWADPAPATAVVAPPAVGCSGCATPCNDCCKPSLFERWKGRFHHEDCGCAPAPVHVQASCGCEPTLFERLKGCFAKSDCGCAPAPVYHPAPAYTLHSGCGCESWKPGFLDNLKARFSHADCGCSTCGSTVIGAPAGTIITSPTGTAPGGAPTMEKIPTAPSKEASPTKLPIGATNITPSSLRLEPLSGVQNKETPDPFELDRRYEARVDRAADYSWLTGQLFYVHTDGGLWVLRYAPLAKEDANGGGVVLARDLQLDRYREGDLVKVHGSIIADRGSSHLSAPLYRATSIQLVERDQ
jgi:hypothetical protein